jgi:hypothetical protein
VNFTTELLNQASQTLSSGTSNMSTDLANQSSLMTSLPDYVNAWDLHMAEFVTACIVVVLCVIGIIGNCVLVAKVIINQSLHTSTFTAISVLGVSDLLLLITTLYGVTLRHFLLFDMTSVWLQVAGHVGTFAWATSAAHVALLAGVRFMLLVHPLYCIAHLTVAKVLCASVCIWFVGVATTTVLGHLSFTYPVQGFIYIAFWTTFWYSLTLVATAILHIMKVVQLRRASPPGTTGSGSRNNCSRRMSTAVATVILAFIILPLPFVVDQFLWLYFPELENRKPYWTVVFDILASPCVICNSAINPVIYGLFSLPLLKKKQSLRRGQARLLHIQCLKK